MLEVSKAFDTIIIFPAYLFFFRRNYDYAKLLEKKKLGGLRDLEYYSG